MKSSYASLLTHIDSQSTSVMRLDVACHLARSQDAQLTALYAVNTQDDLQPFALETGPVLSAVSSQVDARNLEQARALVERARLAGTPGVTFEALQAELVAPAFARRALCADLLVLGQHDPGSPKAPDVEPDFAASVMALSGKPALLLPYTGQVRPDFATVAIAWSPTREAARAVQAALPLLQRAATVHVLGWSRKGLSVSHDGLDLGRWLEARGVHSTLHHHGHEPEELGELLLSTTFNLGADLLVMGCYGHSRAREWLLGGTTRTVLRSMTLPVLMSH